MKPNVKDFDQEQLARYLAEHGQPAYRANQIRRWLFQRGALSFEAMSNLSAPLRLRLAADFSISRPGMAYHTKSRDGTVKFLFELGDGESVESVLIPESRRLTLCISSQVGCGFGCAFCATARMGLKRNLRASEIVDQLLEARRYLDGARRISHVVLMGMGEPLANYPETLKALEIVADAGWGIGISPRRVTLSTVGLVPQIERLMRDTRVNLAISLHAGDEKLRGSLMPVNRKYSLRKLIDCCRSLPIPRRKRITFEYVLLKGVNDSEEQARDLSRLLGGIRCKLNVIPFNPHAGSAFERPDNARVERFERALQERGLQVNVRRARGDDIQAACGQLRIMDRESPSRDRGGMDETRLSAAIEAH